MHIKVQLSDLTEIPAFETIRERAARQAYEHNARNLEARYSLTILAIIERHVSDPVLVAALHHDIMYSLTHTEVNHPPIVTND